MPNLILDHYIEMLPILIAERKFDDLDVSSFPHLTEEGRERTLERLAYALEGSTVKEKKQDVDQQRAQHRRMVEGVGIKVVREKRRK